jgi:hypothetical protein
MGIEGQMNKREYQQLRDKLRQEYEQRLSALDMVWQMVSGKPAAPSGVASIPGSPAPWIHSLSKRDVVRQAAKSISTDFTMHRVRQAIIELHPTISPEINDNALSAILSKLAEMEEIKVVRAKVGKSPAVYTNV